MTLGSRWTWDCPLLACALASGWLGIPWTSTGKHAGSRGLEAWVDMVQWLGMAGGLPDEEVALAGMNGT